MDPATSALFCNVQKALGVLCALLLLGRPAGILDLAALLNCDAKTVRRQLEILVRQHLFWRHAFRNGFTVNARGLNFWFGECGKFSHVAASTTTTTDLYSSSDEDKLNTGEVAAAAAVKVEKYGSSKKGPENGQEEDEPLSDQAAENLAAFRSARCGRQTVAFFMTLANVPFAKAIVETQVFLFAVIVMPLLVRALVWLLLVLLPILFLLLLPQFSFLFLLLL